MNPATLIMQAKQDGVLLALSDTGNLKATGNPAAVSRRIPAIREHKLGVIAVLRAANDSQGEQRLVVGDHHELDALIHCAAAHTSMSAERLAAMLAVRKRMAPALIQGDVDQLRELIAETDSERRNHAND